MKPLRRWREPSHPPLRSPSRFRQILCGQRASSEALLCVHHHRNHLHLHRRGFNGKFLSPSKSQSTKSAPGFVLLLFFNRILIQTLSGSCETVCLLTEVRISDECVQSFFSPDESDVGGEGLRAHEHGCSWRPNRHLPTDINAA